MWYYLICALLGVVFGTLEYRRDKDKNPTKMIAYPIFCGVISLPLGFILSLWIFLTPTDWTFGPQKIIVEPAKILQLSSEKIITTNLQDEKFNLIYETAKGVKIEKRNLALLKDFFIDKSKNESVELLIKVTIREPMSEPWMFLGMTLVEGRSFYLTLPEKLYKKAVRES